VKSTAFLQVFKAARPVLMVVLVSCGSTPPELGSSGRLNQATNTKRANTIVDELSGTDMVEWTTHVRALEEPLRLAVNQEVARRAIVVCENATTVEEVDNAKEMNAALLLVQKADGRLDGLTDFIVFVSAHQGHSGFDVIYGIGVKAFPSILKLRQDRHHGVSKVVGKLLVEYVLGSFRHRGHSDAAVKAFCTEEAARCPHELQPHYHALLAALGDPGALEAIPQLLNSDVVPDWDYAHRLAETMFRKAPPLGYDELRHVRDENTSTVQGRNLWPPLNQKLQEWWRQNRDRMVYLEKQERWELGNK